MTELCVRCGKTRTPISAAIPLPEALADEVRGGTCAACWDEWADMEVKVINELRLNFMDPAALEVLHLRMREFLGFVEPENPDAFEFGEVEPTPADDPGTTDGDPEP